MKRLTNSTKQPRLIVVHILLLIFGRWVYVINTGQKDTQYNIYK